jgi:DNA topoisomerase-3
MNKPQAEELKKKLTSIGVATGNYLSNISNFPSVVDVQSKEKKRARPTGLNTVEMLKHASSRLGMGPQHALSVAERLYLQGFLTYPRTESTAYPDKFDHNSVVSAISVGYS